MKISYVTTSTDNIASYRYRVLAPAQYLRNNSCSVSIDRLADKKASIVLFGKHWNSNDWSYAEMCRQRGQKIVFDICDDHFNHKRYGAHYRRMLDVAHVITVNSEAMAHIVEQFTNKITYVIPDPVLTEQVPYDPSKPLSLMWYGQRMNLQGLLDAYPVGCTVPLEIFTLHPFDLPEHMRHSGIKLSQWHENCIQEGAARNSAALLPYRQEKVAKSANRVLEALNCGIPVLTDRIPSVANLGFQGVLDLKAGTQACLESLKVLDLSEDIRQAQKMINLAYSRDAIGQKWEELFLSIAWGAK